MPECDQHFIPAIKNGWLSLSDAYGISPPAIQFSQAAGEVIFEPFVVIQIFVRFRAFVLIQVFV